jgi:ABC-type ATPase involved in cell division
VNLRGTTVIVATHNANLIGRQRRRMVVLHQGRVLEATAAEA